MTAVKPAILNQTTSAATLPGTWKLGPGRAVTLRPTTDGILRIAHGMVWATCDGPHGLAPQDSGDQVLGPGRGMYVRAGQRLVIESWSCEGAAYFSWDPVFAPVTVAAATPRVNLAAVLQPLADLRAATGMAGAALLRLALGVGRLLLDLVRPRGWNKAAA